VRSLVPPLRSLIAIDVVLWVVTVFINRATGVKPLEPAMEILAAADRRIDPQTSKRRGPFGPRRSLRRFLLSGY
jgi:hypothetical protein